MLWNPYSQAHWNVKTISSRLKQVQRGLSLLCKITSRPAATTCLLRKATSTSWSTIPTLTGGMWQMATGMVPSNVDPVSVMSVPNKRLFAPALWPEAPALYPALTWRKKRATVLKDFSKFYLIHQTVGVKVSDNGLLIESFVVCHSWYSKIIKRMEAQELLIKKVKRKKL